MPLRCEVLAIGTELLLGQIVDTNSAWLGEQLAESGIDSHEHRVIGDNQARIVVALRDLLSRADAVLVCGGLGPTQDDLTRDAIAEVMGVGLERQHDLVDHIAAMFRSRARDMPENNLRQADIPAGGEAIPNPIGTAPGLKCAFDGKVVYAVPGVPYEMQLMVTDHVLPDLRTRSGDTATIVSRSLKTWGTSESELAEMIAARVDTQTNPTIAFLARGIEGLVVRITAKAATEAGARTLLDAEERLVREIIGDIVFAVDDETMEQTVVRQLIDRGWTLGVAESLTGGLIGARIVDAVGASEAFLGSVAAYATDVKRTVLGVTAESVVSEDAAAQMAEGARRVLAADVGIAATGVAGPTEQDGVPVGTVCFGLALPDRPTETLRVQLPGDRVRIRQFSTISLLNLLRQRLAASG
jgi:nicotinamide-nucleotide amidase